MIGIPLHEDSQLTREVHNVGTRHLFLRDLKGEHASLGRYLNRL